MKLKLVIIAHFAGGLFGFGPAALAASVETSYPFQGVTRYHIQTSVPRLVDINLLRIDPAVTGISFLVTPSNGAGPGETVNQTTRSFVAQHGLQIGVNGNFFTYDPGTPNTDLVGLAVSSGEKYSQFYANYPALNITADNQASIVTAIPGNQSFTPPFNSGYVPAPTVNLFNAVAGNDFIVRAGQNTASWMDGLNPRTAAGITADGQLLLCTVDGRNAGHSLGMTTAEVADVLISYGAQSAINLDGGGSSTMVFVDPTPRVINIPVGIGNQPGSERSVGNNLGVHALSYFMPKPTTFVFADFEAGDLGTLEFSPGASGSTQGINKASSTNEAASGKGHNSAWSQRLTLIDDPAANAPADNPGGGWFVRELSGSSASRFQNVPRPTHGYIGFWAMTLTAGIDASIAIDNTNNITADRGVRQRLIADGQWRLYEWDLDNPTQWEAFFQGDGAIDSADFTLDSLMFFGPASNAVIHIDDVAHNSGGRLATVPEPVTSLFGFLAIACAVPRVVRSWRDKDLFLWQCVLLSTCFVVDKTFAENLPAVANKSPVPAVHFPDALHAIVWRNWELVPPDRLAKVLGTTPENVTELAASMGLPRDVSVSPAIEQRGYITLLRRNWHLLPYSQLLQLLDISEQELAFRLREDDFLYIKLGSLKPNCQPIAYAQPTAAARQREEQIRGIVQSRVGDALKLPAEPRFSFIGAFNQNAELAAPTAANSKGKQQIRFIYSYFAIFGDPLLNPELDPYPNGLLAQLQAQGVNGIWLHTVLRQLAPGGDTFPEFGEGHATRLANLRQLVERAKRYGIDVYLYVNEPRAMPNAFFQHRSEMAGVREGDYTALCTSDPPVRQWLTDSLAYVFEQVPGLGGVFTITASENLTNCASHHGQKACPRCANRSEAEIITEVVAAIERGVHRSAPDAKVIAYDWGWNSHHDATRTIAGLPKSIYLMSVSEWALPIHRGRVPFTVEEYSISAVGPGPRATRHWAAAKERGLKTIAKVQLNNSWELSSVPYLPVLNLVGQHCERLAKADVDGLMLSWSLGGYPSLNLELAKVISEQDTPDAITAIRAMAELHYGQRAAPHVCDAWKKFSDAFTEYPYSGEVLYYGPQQMGPANPLYLTPTTYAATMVGIPYDDLDQWRGPYPPETFADQFQKVADCWAQGLADLKTAISDVPDELKRAALADLRVAQAAQLHFASVADQARFLMARNKLTKARGEEAEHLRGDMIAVLDREITRARALFDLSSADSRLGYEASNHYFYVPLDLIEKIVNCEFLKQQLSDHPLKQ